MSDQPYPEKGQGMPPPYQQATAYPLSYVDFCPIRVDGGGEMFAHPKYETFDALVAKANQWLQQNPTVKVKSCESIESERKYKATVADTNTSTLYEWGDHVTEYNRSLRIWISSKDANDNPQPQVLGYLNVVPGCTKPGGAFSKPEFEDFGTTIAKMNEILKNQPLQGRILNMETQNMMFENWLEDITPDRCYWAKNGKFQHCFLMVIRIFYEAGSPVMEEIGTADFVPTCLKPEAWAKHPEFQTIGETVAVANNWISQQQGVRITNVQSIDYKIKSDWNGQSIDTMRSLYTESGGSMVTSQLRVIRVYWCRPFGSSYPPSNPITLSYRTFLPAQTKAAGTGFGNATYPQFETQAETMKRALAWLNATGARVLSAETIPIWMMNRSGGIVQTQPDSPYSTTGGRWGSNWLIGLRVFVDGVYQDPPPEALPPVPAVQPGENCCNIL